MESCRNCLHPHNYHDDASCMVPGCACPYFDPPKPALGCMFALVPALGLWMVPIYIVALVVR